MGSPVNVISSKATKNYCINGQFDFFQRRGSPSWVNEGNLYTADRWFRFKQTGGGTGVFTNIQDAGLGNGSRSLKIGRPSGATDVNQTEIIQALESKDSIELSGKKVTLSFKIRKGANFSGSQVNFYIGYGTGSDQGVVSAWTGQGVINGTPILAADLSASTYYQVKLTTTLPTINQLRFDINYVPVGTAGANDWIEITEVMLNLGDFVPYVRHKYNYQDEYQSCLRYYCKAEGISVTPGTTNLGSRPGSFSAFSSAELVGNLKWPVPMRATPTVTLWDNANNAMRVHRWGVADHPNAVTVTRVNEHGMTSLGSSGLSTTSPTEKYGFSWAAEAEL